MPPCLSLRDWHQGGKSTPPVPCAVHLSSRPRFLHFTLNHHKFGAQSHQPRRWLQLEVGREPGDQFVLAGRLSCNDLDPAVGQWGPCDQPVVLEFIAAEQVTADPIAEVRFAFANVPGPVQLISDHRIYYVDEAGRAQQMTDFRGRSGIGHCGTPRALHRLRTACCGARRRLVGGPLGRENREPVALTHHGHEAELGKLGPEFFGDRYLGMEQGGRLTVTGPHTERQRSLHGVSFFVSPGAREPAPLRECVGDHSRVDPRGSHPAMNLGT